MRLIVMLMLACALGQTVGAEPAHGPLVVATWGGVYERSQRAAYFDPYTEATGTPIQTASYSGGLGTLRKRVQGPGDWDVIDMTMADHRRACAEGLLQSYSGEGLMPAPDGTPAERDFIRSAITPCGVAHNLFSTVVAFDEDFFRYTAQPHRIEHLFDTERFPGKRALHKRPDALLEWALLSYGVPVGDLYDLLSTERGLNLAFKRLDEIREHIVWWESPEEAVELLRREDVTFAMGYNGRFFDAAVVQNEPVRIIWDAQVYEFETWGIPRNAAHPERARQFIGYATRTQSLARQTRYIAYGPTRASAIRRVGKHASTGVDMRAHMPSHPLHMERAIRKDVDWYAHTRQHLNERFQVWLAAGDAQ
ncbi:MAG: extracellular solute-binding protein [Halofilum sp. (in: g-proteobacteria)]